MDNSKSFRTYNGNSILRRPLADLVLMSILFLTSFVDIFQKIKLGPISMNGVLTVLYSLVMLLLLAFRRRSPTRANGVLLWGFLMAGWAACSTMWTKRLTVEAIQNISVLLTFASSVGLASALRAGGGRMHSRKWLTRSTYLSSGIFLLTAAHLYGIQARAYALYAAVGLMWLAAGWRVGERKASIGSLVVLACIGISLSRTAFITCVFLLPWVVSFRPKNIKGWIKPGIIFVVLATLAVTAIISIKALHKRFLEAGDRGLTVNGTTLSTEGRAVIWRVVYDDAMLSPVIGRGAGSATDLVIHTFGQNIAQPHNDYLRLFHDYGLCGLTLWFGWIGTIFLNLRRSYREARITRNISGEREAIAALAGLLVILGGMATDNVVIYPGPMFLEGMMIGLACGIPSATRKTAKGSWAQGDLQTV